MQKQENCDLFHVKEVTNVREFSRGDSWYSREVFSRLGICSHTNKNLEKLHQLAKKYGLGTKNLKRKDVVDHHQHQKRRSSEFVKNSCEVREESHFRKPRFLE
ncbi:hypothetical protein NL108_014350 [Boleophthalmus pectinirostris]|nr:hypothetical protein NL108_014350 [Boleophthalmus pectinirostris]